MANVETKRRATRMFAGMSKEARALVPDYMGVDREMTPEEAVRLTDENFRLVEQLLGKTVEP